MRGSRPLFKHDSYLAEFEELCGLSVRHPATSTGAWHKRLHKTAEFIAMLRFRRRLSVHSSSFRPKRDARTSFVAVAKHAPRNRN